MRRVSNEPRQVRKEAAVVVRSVCCGVPGLFFCLVQWKLPFYDPHFFDFFLPADQETNILTNGDKFLIPSNCP